jgi:hypothetical protein
VWAAAAAAGIIAQITFETNLPQPVKKSGQAF